MNDIITQKEVTSRTYIKENVNNIESSVIKNLILKSSLDRSVCNYINRFILFENSVELFDSNDLKQFQNLPIDCNTIINIHKINDFRHINKYFDIVNKKLISNGIFICCVETYNHRRKKILSNFPKVLSYPYNFLDFIWNRVFPKFILARKIIFYFTKGKNRALSKTEAFGRLVSCGFEIADYKEISNCLYIVCKKKKETPCDSKTTNGFFIKLKKYGQRGKLINVYKIRTMHPFSEYLQDYVYKRNKKIVNGKYSDDFRISNWGRILRKYWIDELPMVINFLKCDVKLFGVRPLSPHYYNLYREKLKQKREKYKPGLMPPFYADLPKDLNEKMDSEERYLNAYDKNPFKTDLKYFIRALYNIVIKGARSS